MTIRKGSEWAEPASQEQLRKSIQVADDNDLAAKALQFWEAGEPLVASPGEGDALKTLGLERARRDETAMVYAWDLGLVEFHLAGSVRQIPFVSHVLLHRRYGLGQMISIMNTPWFGRYRLGPKAHPNDGLFDITNGTLPMRELIQARQRALTGSHLPHPGLVTSRSVAWDMSFERNMRASVDHVPVKSAERVSVSLIPDAFAIVA